MAIENMTDAEPGKEASSAEYNKVTANVRNLDARVAAMEAGSIRFRTVRTTGGNITTAKFTWPDAPEYANGIVRTRNNTAFKLPTPGMYLVVAQIGVGVTVSSGNRLILFVGLADDDDTRFGENVYPLPATLPTVQTTALVLVTQPIEIAASVWTNTTATMPIYTNTNRTSLTITYLGGDV